MSTQIQFRRGTTAQHATFTGALAEVTVDTDKDTVVVHDGSTVGGTPLAKEVAVVALTGNQTVAGIKTFSSAIQGKITDLDGGLIGQVPYQNGAGDTAFLAAGSSGQFLKSNGAAAPEWAAPSIAQIQSLTATVAANVLTIAVGSLTLDFRSTTLGTGTATTVTSDPADLVISSGSTLGTTNAVQSDIAILALNNAGTIELAAVNMDGGVDLSETGLISTTAEGGSGGADSATVAYSTTARTSLAYRVIGIVRSTQATAGTWATSPSLVQGAGGNTLIKSAPSMVRLRTANGYGSTNGKIRRWTTTVTNQGSDITYADSATLGGSFTINTSGRYAISYSDQFNTGDQAAITVNDSAPTAAYVSADNLASAQTGGTNAPIHVSWSGYLVAGSVIRARSGNGSPSGIQTRDEQFTICRMD